LSTSAHDPVEKIYLTYKTRMTTEARLRRQAKYHQFMISWYSFWTIVAALIEFTGTHRLAYSNIVLASFSIGIFSLSLYVAAERFEERASKFKECYLELQDIYNSSQASSDKMTQYGAALKRYDNQSDADYDEMLFDAWLRGQSLCNARGPVSITFLKGVEVLFRRAMRFAGVVGLVVAPVACLYYFVDPVSSKP
jgi:hypothetical protein